MGFLNIREAIAHLLHDDVVVLNTHWHFDHVGSNAEFDEIGISKMGKAFIEHAIPSQVMQWLYVEPMLADGVAFPIGFDPEEYLIRSSKATFHIKEGEHFDLGGRILEIITTPGHSRDSNSFLDYRTGSLFVGDFVYKAEMFIHFTESSLNEMLVSLEKLLRRETEIKQLFPSHGPYPLPTTFLRKVQAACQEIIKGRACNQVITAWGGEVLIHAFDGFEVWVKFPGDGGIDLVKILTAGL
jgi:glyoxylase-like metal-dependent hydrolase (beta-lactamase superfamily II)